MLAPTKEAISGSGRKQNHVGLNKNLLSGSEVLHVDSFFVGCYHLGIRVDVRRERTVDKVFVKLSLFCEWFYSLDIYPF